MSAVPLVHTIDEAAVALGLLSRNGKPNRRAVHDLVRSGAVRIADADLPIGRWTISRVELERYSARLRSRRALPRSSGPLKI